MYHSEQSDSCDQNPVCGSVLREQFLALYLDATEGALCFYLLVYFVLFEHVRNIEDLIKYVNFWGKTTNLFLYNFD